MTSKYRWLPDRLYYFAHLPLLSRLKVDAAFPLLARTARRWPELQPDRRSVILQNLEAALPERADRLPFIMRRMFEYQALEELEAYYWRRWSRTSLQHVFRFSGLDKVEEALASGRGVMMVSGHLGPFTSAAVALGLQGYPLNYMAHSSPSDPAFTPAFRRYARMKISWMEKLGGAKFLLTPVGDRDRSSAEAGLALLSRLRSNQIVAFAVDVPPQHFSHVDEVEFLGRKARFPSGFLELVYRSGARLLPFFSVWDQDGRVREIRVESPVELTGDRGDDLQLCVDRLSRQIETSPEQWFHWDSLGHFWAPTEKSSHRAGA